MELHIRPMCFEERKYAYEQSSQLMSQTGSIGRLEATLAPVAWSSGQLGRITRKT